MSNYKLRGFQLGVDARFINGLITASNLSSSNYSVKYKRDLNKVPLVITIGYFDNLRVT